MPNTIRPETGQVRGQFAAVQAGSLDWASARYEMSLESLLKDDIVRLTMASDGVSVEDIRALARISPLIERSVLPG